VYNYGGGILENCDSPRYMIHHVAGYVTSYPFAAIDVVQG
jgi:hypothetical protein